jgi:spore coat polysaccharide biosynthesis predicted glycosyltransferase SpsG
VLDGYQFNQQYRQQLVKKCALKIAVFDDTNDLSQLYCQWVINALPDARQLGYERSAASAKHLLGLPYSIIRQEFLVQKPMFFSKRKNLLINFGGSDIGGLTLPIVKGIAEQLLMNNLDCSAQDVIVVTGGGCKNNKEIQTFCQQMGFHHIHQCEYMAKLLTKTRLAVCAPGAIVYELAYCQVPSIFLTVADNQLLSAKAHQQAGWGVVFDGRSDNDVQLALQEFTKLWQDKAQLKKMSSIAALLVDGKGVERIVSAITETYLDDEFEQQHEKNND